MSTENVLIISKFPKPRWPTFCTVPELLLWETVMLRCTFTNHREAVNMWCLGHFLSFAGIREPLRNDVTHWTLYRHGIFVIQGIKTVSLAFGMNHFLLGSWREWKPTFVWSNAEDGLHVTPLTLTLCLPLSGIPRSSCSPPPCFIGWLSILHLFMSSMRSADPCLLLTVSVHTGFSRCICLYTCLHSSSWTDVHSWKLVGSPSVVLFSIAAVQTTIFLKGINIVIIIIKLYVWIWTPASGALLIQLLPPTVCACSHCVSTSC